MLQNAFSTECPLQDWHKARSRGYKNKQEDSWPLWHLWSWAHINNMYNQGRWTQYYSRSDCQRTNKCWRMPCCPGESGSVLHWVMPGPVLALVRFHSAAPLPERQRLLCSVGLSHPEPQPLSHGWRTLENPSSQQPPLSVGGNWGTHSLWSWQVAASYSTVCSPLVLLGSHWEAEQGGGPGCRLCGKMASKPGSIILSWGTHCCTPFSPIWKAGTAT